MNQLKLTKVDAPATLEEIYKFRARVWDSSKGIAVNAFPTGKWQDQHDATALHWIVTNADNQMVGAARLSLHERMEDVVEPEQYLRYGVECDGLIAAPDRVVVCPSARRQGIAQRLLDVQNEASVDAGAACALRQASPAMCRLVEKRDWHLLGPASIDPRFPNIVFTVALRAFSPAQVRFQAQSRKAAA